jgi:hypothetical protein
MSDGNIRSRMVETLPDAMATSSTTTIFYPNWQRSARDPVNKEFLDAVIRDVKALEVSMFGI